MKTYFYRAKKERDYTVIDNTFLKDKRLSAKAKGIFAYLLMLPEDRKIYIDEIVNNFADGETSIRNGIKELEKYGYIKREKVRDEKGKFISTVYYIIERPQENPRSKGEFIQKGKNALSGNTILDDENGGESKSSTEIFQNNDEVQTPQKGVENPHVDFPHVDYPDVGFPNVDYPDVDNRALQNTYNTKYLYKQNTNKKNNNKSDFFSNLAKNSIAIDELHSKFEEFWSIYPKKVNKNKARTLFVSVVNSGEVSADQLIEKAKQYKEHVAMENIDKKFIKNPDRWLEDGNYFDEYEHVGDEDAKIQKIYELRKSCGWQKGRFYKQYPERKEFFRVNKEKFNELLTQDPDWYRMDDLGIK